MRLQASLHSLRRASIGFTLAARRAGAYAAASPPAISVRVTAVIVHGSCTVTWVVHRHMGRAPSLRRAACAATAHSYRPASAPYPARTAASTIAMTRPRYAPSASSP
jgi:hypothetical protein